MTYDGPRIFRAPIGNSAAQENFERTVLAGVDQDRHSRYSDFAPEDSTVRMWGTKETVRGTWEDISPGDYLIFYRDGIYEYAAEVQGTEENEALGREVWPNFEEDQPWLCIIYLREPVELGVDSAEIHELAGYDIEYPMGFSPLNEMGIGGIRGRYGSVESFVHGGDSTSGIDISIEPRFEVPADALDGLYFPEEFTKGKSALVDQVNDALNAGKHIIFTGPPGTGKTEVARRVAAHVTTTEPDAYTGYEMTTATADWSTFETVGGYMPDEESTGDLDFTAGQVLRCFKRHGQQRNDLLIIDEINRSDIDKSFGQLFTLLSGQGVQLPFTVDGEEVEILPSAKFEGTPESHEFVAPSSWRVFATMNSYDKASLYEMSYAFMRRFAFVYVGAPIIPPTESEQRQLVERYAEAWDLDAGDQLCEDIGAIWYELNVRVDERPIGPAIIRDIISHVRSSNRNRDVALTDAVASYVFPQLEGVRNRDRVVDALARLDRLRRDELLTVATDVLQVQLDE